MSLDFSVTYSFRPYHGPGVDSVPSENEYQEHFLGVKVDRFVWLTTLPPSCAEFHEIWEPKPPGTLWATPGLLRDSCALFIYIMWTYIYKFCVYPKLISAQWTARLMRGCNMNWEYSVRAWTGTWNSEMLLAPPASRVMIRCMHVTGMLAPSLGREVDLISAKLGSNSARHRSVCCIQLKYHSVHFLCC